LRKIDVYAAPSGPKMRKGMRGHKLGFMCRSEIPSVNNGAMSEGTRSVKKLNNIDNMKRNGYNTFFGF
jgi:hypothetical protein